MAEQGNNTKGKEPIVPRTAAEVCSRKPRSGVWEDFTCFIGDDGKKKAECKCCRQLLGAETRNGTSTLWTHARICKRKRARERGDAEGGAEQPPPYAPSSSHSHSGRSANPPEVGQLELEPDKLEVESFGYLARMIALHGYDPSVVEDDYFRSFVRRLSPQLQMPSRLAIEHMCDGIFDEVRKDLLYRRLDEVGSVSLAVGRAKTMDAQVLYTTCHFIDYEWTLHRVLVDAYVIVPFSDYQRGPLVGVPEVSLSTGVYVDRVVDDISRHDVLDKLFMVAWETYGDAGTMDEADISLDDLHELIYQKFCGTYPMIRGLLCYTNLDSLLHVIAECFTLHPEFTNDLFQDMKVLGLTRQKGHQLLSQLGLQDDPWAYDEHWYSCYCCLQALQMKVGECHSATAEKYLGVFTQLLCNIWGAIYRAIKRISAPRGPTSNLCLEELFNLREVLQSELEHTNLYDGCTGFSDNRSVADALTEAKDRLDKVIHEHYPVWCIPLILDPRYKLAYIRFLSQRAFPGAEAEEFVSQVMRRMRNLYSDNVSKDDPSFEIDNDDDNDNVDPLQQAWHEHSRLLRDGTGESHTTEDETELDRYLKDRLVPRTDGFDILNWWKVHSTHYPTLAQMAKEALAMPTSSNLSSEQVAHVKSIIRGYSRSN